MSRSRRLAVASAVLSASALCASDASLWKEFGLEHTAPGVHGKLAYTAYQFHDLTGALAAWEWQRSADDRSCTLAAFCTSSAGRTIVADSNYLVVFQSSGPRKVDSDAILAALPGKTSSSLPALLTFLPSTGLVPNSARYVLGQDSLQAFAPELAQAKAGFEQGAEAQIAEYRLPGTQQPTKLALFYYATPEMARLHSTGFRTVGNVFVKRSGVLVAVVLGAASQQQADTLLSRIQYQARITWNEVPPPSPIKPMYRLLVNIIYMSVLLGALGLMAGVFYGGMRIYRRRYGTLESEEQMTTLGLGGL